LQTTINQPILQSLQKLENILALLAQPRQLDTAARKVKLLLADLGKASALASGAQTPGVRGTATGATGLTVTPTEKEKLEALYALLPRLDPLLPIIPPLLTRLRSLATLHANASSFQATLETLEAQTGEMDRAQGEMRSVLARVEEGLERNARGVQGNWESLEARMGDLMGRLDALEREDR
jgi:nuclear migration protein JNM1